MSSPVETLGGVSSVRPAKPRVLAWRLCAIALVCGLVGLIRQEHLDERLYFYLKTHWYADSWEGRAVWLPGYKARIEAQPIEGVTQNLSAIAFDHDRGNLLAVTNGGPMEMLALDRSGKLTARYPLVGFDDPEGLAYMGNDLVVIADERKHRLVFFELPATPGPIHMDSAQSLTLDILAGGNKGFEGVAYDPEHDRLYVAKERDPRQLYAISGVKGSLAGKLQLEVKDLTEWVDRFVFSTDISSLDFDRRTGHLLVLSDESKLMIELSPEGRVISYRSLLGSSDDLEKTAPQPEGITLDDDGELFVVSEPNLFYAFRKD
ncbi:SdiA-regulated domain-containing protein [Pseudomonas resinovorans]|uniref:SdiA-regulated domain-containing protein n=1 Tax=Metapseudomonas resinovorans TaxID=53412 RepID=UPI00237F746C|nr:SdiA-regulated domain-containing protein [Pseudomonas resinovorans]MDE3738891.1 SdiA-regulated domain-containing protein [Pseudomonas resinovorans]